MKKLLYVFPILLMLLVASIPVTGAQAAQFVEAPEELAYYDAQINVLLPYLDDFQFQYHTINGRYYQALASHSTAPSVPTVPDGLYNSPTDQVETLAYFWQIASLPEELAWSFRIDTYNGPDGEGYVLNIATVIDGGLWRRSINFGPDTSRNAEWYLFIEE